MKIVTKIFSLLSVVVLLCSTFLISAFAFDGSVIGAEFPVMPSAVVVHKNDAGNFNKRALPGFINESGQGVSMQPTGFVGRTFLDSLGVGYVLNLASDSEIFIDFEYLKLKERSSLQVDTSFSVTTSITLNADVTDENDYTCHVIYEYFDADLNLLSTYQIFTLNEFAERQFTFDIYDVFLNQVPSGGPGRPFALKSIQISFLGDEHSNGANTWLYTRTTISDSENYFLLQPYNNAMRNAVSYSYNFGFESALENTTGDFNTAYEAGYNAGYTNGVQYGTSIGYNDGYNAGLSSADNPLISNAYNDGYQAGLASLDNPLITNAYNEGYEKGTADGYSEGYTDGNEWGYDSGFFDGQEKGYDTGYGDGYSNGYSEGNEWGYDEGYNSGIEESIAEMGLFQYIIKSISAVFNIPLGEHFTLGGVLAIVFSVPILILILKLFNGG